MPSVTEAAAALGAALHKKGVEIHVQNAFDNLASYLVLLNSSSPSVQMIRKLCTVLRQPLLPLYNACLQPALQLSCAVLSMVLGKLCDALNSGDESLSAAWDATAEVIFSGILDFLDQKDGTNVELDGAAWEVLYRIICEFFFLGFGRRLSAFSVPLCLSAYNTLTEIAARQIGIQNVHRQRAVLGGERLGAAISGTRDYLLLEALLVLFARLLPPTHNTSQGKLRRFKFVKEVLGSPKLFKCSAELLDIMQNTSVTHWDDIAAQIIDVLAKTDITYPQPFSIDEIDVCGRVFPQPLATDRLIMDKQAFLANIVAENDDVCESLQVPYSHIRTITLDNSEKAVPKGKVSIMVYLTSPPLVANVRMQSPIESCLHAKFLLQNDAVGRFMEALRRRGVGKLNFLNPPARVERKRKSISIGSELKFTNVSSPIPPTVSFEGKVQHVNEVYTTDIEDPTTTHAVTSSHFGDTGSWLTSGPKFSFKTEVLETASAEDVLPTIKSARLVTPADETSRTIQNLALPSFPGNSTRTTHLSGDSDELSEISEFEPDPNTPSARAATRAPASCNNGLKPLQHRIARIQMKEHPGAASKGNEESPEFASNTASRTEGAAQRSLETGKPPLTSGSPLFGSSSSTQIDVSPKLLSNADTLFTATGTEVLEGLSVTSQSFVDADKLKEAGVNESGPSDTEHIIPSAGKPQIASSPARDGFEQHARRSIPSSGANQEVQSRIEIARDRSVPPRISGSHRKREPIKTSSKHVIDVDDESAPPRKKSREDRPGTHENKVKSKHISLDVIPISRMKRCTTTAKRSPPVIDATTAVNFDEQAKLKPTCQGTRRSSRIRKRQTAATGGTRSNAARGKTQKGKQTVSQSTCGVECKKLAAVSPRDAGVKMGHITPSVLSSHPIPPLVRESPSPKVNGQVPLVELRSAENITPETDLPQEMLKGNSIPTYEPSQPNVTPGEGPRENLDFIQGAASNAMQLVQEQFHIKTEEIMADRHLMSEVRSLDNKVNNAQKVVEYSVSSKMSEESVKPSQPVAESTPRTETVTIDLTTDDPPARERDELHKASVDLVCSKVDIRTKLKTSDPSDSVAIEEPAFVPSPRQRRRSVTFASPIEYVLDQKAKFKAQVSSSSHQHPSPSESNTFSPLRIPTGTLNVRRESPGQITPRVTLQNSNYNKASGHNKSADEAEIQDIVDVLNEIQAVIIKGISDKFRNIKKDVQRSRDELIQQVLDELREIAIENAKYFNGLLRLEEDYHKHCKAITRCWEELIDCNDGIAVQFQNALKEHDQDISARTLSKSLLPVQPVFPRRRA